MKSTKLLVTKETIYQAKEPKYLVLVIYILHSIFYILNWIFKSREYTNWLILSGEFQAFYWTRAIRSLDSILMRGNIVSLGSDLPSQQPWTGNIIKGVASFLHILLTLFFKKNQSTCFSLLFEKIPFFASCSISFLL